MIKDAYSILRIQDTWDYLQGAIWFTLLDLKSGYWQVELMGGSKALMAFTVGPLGFNKCEWLLSGGWVMKNLYGTSSHTDLKDAKWHPKQYHRYTDLLLSGESSLSKT